MVPRGPLDLLPLSITTSKHGKAADFVMSLQDIHQTVRTHLEQAIPKYKTVADKKRRQVTIAEGDLV